MEMAERLKKIRELSKIPMKSNADIKRVEIIVLKFQEEPKIIDECISRIVHNTQWPFKLTVYDNRPNTANTSRIWNFLLKESTCEYIAILDSDAFVEKTEPCWLTRMMESIEDKGIVLPMGDNIGGSNRATAAAPYPAYRSQEGIFSMFCGLYKKSALEKLGMFDEDFYLYGQDSEFAHRCLKKMGGATFRTDVFVHHIGSYSAKKDEATGNLDREADKMYARSLFLIKTKQK